MRLRTAIATQLVGILALTCGCTTAPILNIRHAPVPASQTRSLDDVERAILEAARSEGWEVTTEGPGHVIATLRPRQHVAVVDITFTTQDYSITYRDSQVLRYDGSRIHHNYNRWVANLNRAIEMRL